MWIDGEEEGGGSDLVWTEPYSSIAYGSYALLLAETPPTETWPHAPRETRSCHDRRVSGMYMYSQIHSLLSSSMFLSSLIPHPHRHSHPHPHIHTSHSHRSSFAQSIHDGGR